MTFRPIQNQTLRRIIYFFPFQLVLIHLRSNQILLIFWVLLFSITTSNFAGSYGVPYLFLDPEYLGNVDVWSYMIMGFAVGGFIMAFNISSYIMNSYRFHFLATLSKPFFKYCVNNSIIPLAFVITYLVEIITFQYQSEFLDERKIFIDAFGFLMGIILFIGPATTYFFTTNKDIFRLLGIKVGEDNKIKAERPFAKPIKVILQKNYEWRRIKKQPKEEDEWTVETYLNNPFQVMLTRDTDHYDRDTLKKVFEQNHLNAALFEILAVITIVGLGIFREVLFIQLPAGATIILVCTILLMLASAIHTMLRQWSPTFFIGIFILLYIFSRYDLIDPHSPVYGINYDTTHASYSYKTLDSLQANFINYQDDYKHTTRILGNWKKKNIDPRAKRRKPKMVLICANGGGLRSAVWTFSSLQYADSILNGELLSHTQLITGSSGGMIGAAYLRELYLKSQTDTVTDPHLPKYRSYIAQDMLNPIAFTLAINDVFIRFQTIEDRGRIYTKDRGYAMEKQLNANTEQVLNKRLKDYREPEEKAQIPMMVFTPTIINDGRTLYISPQPVSYLTQKPVEQNFEIVPLTDGVEFRRFFQNHDADELWFSSALRMSATFPYISPAVTLPSKPKMDIMDAGLRDNYGVLTALKFLYTFRNWISNNTSGVVILQIRDKHKIYPIEENQAHSIIHLLTRPLGNVYDNIFNIQDYNNDEMLRHANQWLEAPIEVIDFQLRNEGDENISLSWHLTTQEKVKIRSSLYLPENQKAILRLQKLLE